MTCHRLNSYETSVVHCSTRKTSVSFKEKTDMLRYPGLLGELTESELAVTCVR